MEHVIMRNPTPPPPPGRTRDPLAPEDATAWHTHFASDGPAGNLRTTLMCAVVIAGMLIGPASAQIKVGYIDPDAANALNIDPANDPAIQASPVLSQIFDSTAAVFVTDRHWHLLAGGTATFLAGTSINGFPAAVTARHVVDLKNDQITDGHIILVSNQGKVLGVADPIYDPAATSSTNPDADYPIILKMNLAYPVNRQAMTAITGVAIADKLPAGVSAGMVGYPITAEPGASGGGWYDRTGALVGVITSVRYTPGAPTADVMSNNPEAGAFLGKPGYMAIVRSAHTSGLVYVQSLSDSTVLRQLKVEHGRFTMAKEKGVYQTGGTFGFGYPDGLAAEFRGTMAALPDGGEKYLEEEAVDTAQAAASIAAFEKTNAKQLSQDDAMIRRAAINPDLSP